MEAWVIRQAGGNPGILLLAASLGAELRQKAENFTVDVADALKKKVRRKLGDEAIESLQLLSLLTNVGIKEKARQEIELICKWFGDTLQPQSVTKNLTRLADAGVVRVRGLYAEVIPPLFANALAVTILDGCFTKLLALFAALSQDGRLRLISRLQNLRGDEVDRFWNELFGQDGLFRDLQSALSNGHLLRLVAGAVPNRVVRLIESGFDKMSLEQRLSMPYMARNELVWILEGELLFRRKTSKKALRCLMMLAETEPANYSTSAISVLCECFRPLHSQLPLSLDERLSLLKEILSTKCSVELRLIGVKAIETGLNWTRYTFLRDGSGREPLDSQPAMTWGDVWSYVEELVDLLMMLARSEEPRLANSASTALPQAIANCVFQAPTEIAITRFQTVVDWVLTHQVQISVSDLADALQLAKSMFNKDKDQTDDKEIVNKLEECIKHIETLINLLENSDFPIRLKRWAGNWSRGDHEEVGEGLLPLYRSDKELQVLAKEAVENPETLTDDLLTWLCSEEAKKAYEFFRWLGSMDSKQKWLSRIEKIGATKNGKVAFSTYYSGLSESDRPFVSKRLDELTEANQVSAEAIVCATRCLGGDLAGVKRMEKLIREERVNPIYVEQVLRCGRWINSLSPDEYLCLLKVIAGSNLENLAAVIDFFGMWLHSQLPVEGQLAEFAWQCLEAAPPITGITGTIDSYCDQLAAKLAQFDVERGFKLLEKLLVQPYGCWNPINRYGQKREFCKVLYSNDRKRALRVVLSLSQRYIITYHLHGVVDQEKDADVLIAFALESENQAELVCEIIKFEQPGFWLIVLNIVEKFPDSEGIKVALSSRSKQMLNDDAAPAAARPWLEEFEQSLHEWAEETRILQINGEQNDRSRAVKDLTTPEGLWAIKKLLYSGNLDEIRKLLSNDELQTILAKLQLSENELEELRRKIEN
jgi:hypothetical protein